MEVKSESQNNMWGAVCITLFIIPNTALGSKKGEKWKEKKTASRDLHVT